MSRLARLETPLKELYLKHSKELLFHGWHHITFVRNKAAIFADHIGADKEIVEAAALVHDLNYIVAVFSEPDVAEGMRREILADAGYTQAEIERIESIITEAHTGWRGETISKEGIALSDADTLFKALPITPILFASKFITQNKIDIQKLSHKVVSEQRPLMDKGIYFYTDLAKENYLGWAEQNLKQWELVAEALQDEDVQAMLKIAQELEVI